MENNSPSRSFFSSNASDHPLITSGHVITSNNISIPWIGSIGSTRRASSAVTSPGSSRSPPDDEAEMARRKLKRILHLRSPLSSIEHTLNSHRVVGPSAKVVPPMKVGTKEDDVLVMDAVPFQFARGKEKQRGSPLHKPQKAEEEKQAQGPRVPQISLPTTAKSPMTSPLLKEKTPKEEADKTEQAQGPRVPQISPPTTSKSPMTSPLSKEKTPKKEEADKIEEKQPQGPRVPQISPPPMTSPLSKEKTPKKEEADKIEEYRPQGPSTLQIPPPTTKKTSPLWKEKTPKQEEARPEKMDFQWPPTKEEDEHFKKVLEGPSDKKRLPVFSKICPQ